MTPIDSAHSTSGADVYAVSRARIPKLSSSLLGRCLDSNLGQSWIDDPQTPPVGDGYAYLIQGVDTVCGGGTLGTGSGGAERNNLAPASYGRAIVMEGEIQLSQCVGSSSSPRAFWTEIRTR